LNVHKASDGCSFISFPVVISVVCVTYYEVIRFFRESKESVCFHVHSWNKLPSNCTFMVSM